MVIDKDLVLHLVCEGDGSRACPKGHGYNLTNPEIRCIRRPPVGICTKRKSARFLGFPSELKVVTRMFHPLAFSCAVLVVGQLRAL